MERECSGINTSVEPLSVGPIELVVDLRFLKDMVVEPVAELLFLVQEVNCYLLALCRWNLLNILTEAKLLPSLKMAEVGQQEVLMVLQIFEVRLGSLRVETVGSDGDSFSEYC